MDNIREKKKIREHIFGVVNFDATSYMPFYTLWEILKIGVEEIWVIDVTDEWCDKKKKMERKRYVRDGCWKKVGV